jgi:hypothetical protein
MGLLVSSSLLDFQLCLIVRSQNISGRGLIGNVHANMGAVMQSQ